MKARAIILSDEQWTDVERALDAAADVAEAAKWNAGSTKLHHLLSVQRQRLRDLRFAIQQQRRPGPEEVPGAEQEPV